MTASTALGPPTSKAPPLPSLSLVVLRCRDLDGSKRFFEAMGLEWRSEKHGAGPSHWSCVLDDLVLELYPGSDAEQCTHRLGFRIASIDAILPSIVHARGTVLEHDPDRGYALVRAPNGIKVELSQPDSVGA